MVQALAWQRGTRAFACQHRDPSKYHSFSASGFASVALTDLAACRSVNQGPPPAVLEREAPGKLRQVDSDAQPRLVAEFHLPVALHRVRALRQFPVNRVVRGFPFLNQKITAHV